MSITESKPFECKGVQDDDYEYSLLPCYGDGPQWWQIGRQVAWSMLFWLIMIASSPLLRRIWEAYERKTKPIWVQAYVGTKYRLAHFGKVESTLCVAQFFGSSCLVFLWISKSYHPGQIHDEYFITELLCVLVCFIHLMFDRLKFSFSWKHALSFAVFLDCLTLPPILMQKSGAWAGGSWLTLAYLRVYQVHHSMKRLVQLDFFDLFLSNFMQECIVAALECLVVVFAIAGTLFIMEGLGDIEGFSDSFVDSGMGEISFYQMVYFSFVTISTVGFGDFSPTTVLSRAFIIFAILGGVSFFSYISVHIMQLVELESSGRGHFFPSKKSDRGHILITGGGVTCGSLTVLETFLCALCRDDPYFQTPEIVLMGQTPCSPQVRELITNSEWAQHFQINYFVGSPLNEGDLIRVRASEASMIFIIADFQADNTQTEDRTNLLFAASIQETMPHVQYRLMLCAMHSRSLCSNIGLSEYNCFSIENLKAGMLGTSHRCPGFSTLVLNLGLPDLPVPNTPYSTEVLPDNKYGKWLQEYAIGCSLEPYAFQPIDFLIGLTFKEAVIKASSICNVLLVGVQIDGAILINPSSATIEATSILFCFAEDLSAVKPVAKDNNPAVDSWIEQFQQNRRDGTFLSRQHGKAVHLRSQEDIELIYTTNLDVAHENGILKSEATGQFTGKDSADIDIESSSKENSSGGDSALAGIPVMASISEGFAAASKGKASEGGNRVFVAALRAKKKTIRENISKIKMNATIEDIDILRKQVKQGGHTVVIMLEDQDDLDQQTIWEQLVVIIKCLVFAKDHTPLVVAHALSALPSRVKFLKKHVDLLHSVKVSFCVGDVLDPCVLQAAGCHTCGRILTIAPSAPPPEKSHFDSGSIVSKSDDKMDESHIFLMKILNEYNKVWNRTGHIKVIFDWYSPTSMNVLPIPRLSSSIPTNPEHKPSKEEDDSLPPSETSQEQVAEKEDLNATAAMTESGNNDNGSGEVPMIQVSKPSNLLSSPSKVAPLPPITHMKNSDENTTNKMEEGKETSSTMKAAPHKLSPLSINSSTPLRNDSTNPPPRRRSSPTMLAKKIFSFSSMSEFGEAGDANMDAKGNAIHRISKSDLEFSHTNPRGNCRFAAGFTIPKPFIAALYSMAYYTPGFLELIEALLVPSMYDQTSIPWMFKLPSRFIGKEYSKIAAELLEAGTLPLGLLRPGGIEAGTPFPYVVTLVPTSNLVLSSGDSIYVLACHEWALEHAKKEGFDPCFDSN